MSLPITSFQKSNCEYPHELYNKNCRPHDRCAFSHKYVHLDSIELNPMAPQRPCSLPINKIYRLMKWLIIHKFILLSIKKYRQNMAHINIKNYVCLSLFCRHPKQFRQHTFSKLPLNNMDKTSKEYIKWKPSTKKSRHKSLKTLGSLNDIKSQQ